MFLADSAGWLIENRLVQWKGQKVNVRWRNHFSEAPYLSFIHKLLMQGFPNNVISCFFMLLYMKFTCNSYQYVPLYAKICFSLLMPNHVFFVINICLNNCGNYYYYYYYAVNQIQSKSQLLNLILVCSSHVILSILYIEYLNCDYEGNMLGQCCIITQDQ